MPSSPLRLSAVCLAALAALTALAFAACGRSSNPPQTPGPPTTGETITGRERIGWIQPAQDTAQLATFDFAIYVDGDRRLLEGDACTATGTGSFECSAPLPSLTPGQHTLELASFTSASGTMLESERSTALRVTVAAASPPAGAAEDATLVTSDGHHVRASIVARDLDAPSDLAIAPDGRVFVAERAGRVRLVGPDGPASQPALELQNVAESDGAGLTAIALHPGFARNGHVYAAYATDAPDGRAFVIARFRERHGVLAQAAVIARERASTSTHVVARFGPDGKLYAGFATGNDPREAQDPAAVTGKILRLNDDGTMPRDNPRASTTLSSGHRDPRALVWHPATAAMWELERDREAGDELNRIVAGGDYGWPIARGLSSHSRSVPAALVLPPGTDLTNAAFVPSSSQSALAGELLIASEGAEDLLRVAIDDDGREPGLIEGMLQGRYGRIAAVATSADGTIYFATGNREVWGPGHDILVRLRSERAKHPEGKLRRPP